MVVVACAQCVFGRECARVRVVSILHMHGGVCLCARARSKVLKWYVHDGKEMKRGSGKDAEKERQQ